VPAAGLVPRDLPPTPSANPRTAHVAAAA